MQIKFWDYLREYEEEKDEVIKSILKVLESGYLILGNNVNEFEKTFAEYCNNKYGVGVNSGTDALFLALKAIGVGNDDEVITVANTAVPTVSAIISTGAIARFVDIDPTTYLMDISQIESVITNRTKCILPVHLFGQCVNMDEVKYISQKYGLKIIEDCAQSLGSEFNGAKAGSMSDLAAFSFYPTKILGGYGDGGMVITDDLILAEKIKQLRFYGMGNNYSSDEHGYNSRLDEVQASILLTKLKHVESYIERRKNLAFNYDHLLKNTGLILPKSLTANKHVYSLYVCRHPKRKRIIAELEAHNITVKIHYPYPIHLMKAYQSLGYSEGDLPNTEKAAKEIFSLPLYPSFRDDEQLNIINALKEIMNQM